MSAAGEAIDPRVALGAVLRSARPSDRLRPALAIEALLAAMRAQFQLAPERATAMLAPALIDAKDSVACTDALFVPANAARDPRLLPTPMPSWCAHLVDAGALLLDGRPTLQAGRILQPAALLARLDPQREATTAFPFVFSARADPRARTAQLYLAISPPFSSGAWRGSVLLRAAASRTEKALSVWLGPPASPSDSSPAPAGQSGAGGITWKLDAAPRWLVLRILEGDEPQALWPLPDLLGAKTALARSASDELREPHVSVRMGIDLGSTTIAVVEEDDARAPLAGKLLGSGAVPSGFRLLAGDAASAHRFGCGESLRARAGTLPAALCAASPESLAQVLRGEGFAEQLWLPQAGDRFAAFEVDRFKSPELLLHADWLAAFEGIAALPALEEVSRKLFAASTRLLGRALACAHAAPLSTSEGGVLHSRAPRLGAAEVVLTHPPRGWSTRSAEPFREVLGVAAKEMSEGLRCAWSETSHRLLPDPAAARASRSIAASDRHPIELIADFGGLTLQLAVRVPFAPGRPPPSIAASSTSYLLGGERCLSAAAFALAGSAGASLRESWRASARHARAWTSAELASPEEAAAVRGAIFETILPLLQRQLVGTLRRASPELSGMRSAGVRLLLLGDGWKLLALDAANAQREEAMLGHLRKHLAAQPGWPGSDLLIERIDKPQLCAGALHAASASETTAERWPELQGVDTESGQRFFGLAENAIEPRPSPSAADPFWRELVKGASENLLRVEQWFSREQPFSSRLADGKRAFAPGESLLRQWIDLSGPSLLALRVFDRLQPARRKR